MPIYVHPYPCQRPTLADDALSWAWTVFRPLIRVASTIIDWIAPDPETLWPCVVRDHHGPLPRIKP